MLVSTFDIFAIMIALGISLTLITTTAIRNAELYKDNCNLRRTIRIQNMTRRQRDIHNPWEINPDHAYESQHDGK